MPLPRRTQMQHSPHIKHSIDIEQFLMEGAYNKARSQPPAASRSRGPPPHHHSSSARSMRTPLPQERRPQQRSRRLRTGCAHTLNMPWAAGRLWRQVLAARGQTPDPLYAHFMDLLMTTVRCARAAIVRLARLRWRTGGPCSICLATCPRTGELRGLLRAASASVALRSLARRWRCLLF